MNRPARDTTVTALADPPAVLDHLEQVLLGKRTELELALACLLARGHLLIEDIPGVGKTTLARALASSFGLPWTRLQFTSDLLPADVIGVSIFNPESHAFEFRPGPVFTPVLLADEINRAPPKAQSALLEAMEERQISVDGTSYSLSDDFFVIATQNPADQLGAFPLPESQLDRFLVGLELGLPDAQTERLLLEQGDRRAALSTMLPASNPHQLAQWIEDTANVHIAGPVLDYVLALLQASRASGTGLSPRAGLNLLRLCRAHALLQGRHHVLPDDVQTVFPAVAGHRLTGRVNSGRRAARALLERVASP